MLLRHNISEETTIAVSTAKTPLTERDVADLQRYIDVSRGEIFFARGVILVEGDAERTEPFTDSISGANEGTATTWGRGSWARTGSGMLRSAARSRVRIRGLVGNAGP